MSGSSEMRSLVSALRSVAIEVADVAAMEKFFVEAWHLPVAARVGSSVYLRASGAAHHVIALHPARNDHTVLRELTLRVRSQDDLASIAVRAPSAGGRLVQRVAPVTEPGGGMSIVISDPQGRLIRLVADDTMHVDGAERADEPSRLAHVVFNSADVAQAQAFYERVLGLRLIDRTKIMAFMNATADHHSIAFADSTENSLNHVAFVMPNIESMMRGAGRVRDAGYPIEWGVGRHGPGNNAFAYFIGPTDLVVEYTAEVEQVDESYLMHGPDYWKWPPGRVDHWGISPPPSARLKEAQKRITFVAA